MRRFLDQPLFIGSEITLVDEDYNYIARALRSREGDPITLFNGEGGEYHGNITTIEKRSLTVKLKKFNPINRTSTIKIHLLQSLAKGEKMELILQKSTELGITSFTPLATARSIMHLKKEQSEKRVNRWSNIITSACEQCGLNIPPALQEPISLETWIQTVLPTLNTTLITLAPSAKHSLGSFLQSLNMIAAVSKNELEPIAVVDCDSTTQFNLMAESTLSDLKSDALVSDLVSSHKTTSRSFTIVIGPEGGLNDDEIALLQKSGAHSVTLGSRILRTETAALAVISTLQGLLGDWSQESDELLNEDDDHSSDF